MSEKKRAGFSHLSYISAGPLLHIADFLECEEFGRLFVTSKKINAKILPRLEWRKPFYFIVGPLPWTKEAEAKISDLVDEKNHEQWSLFRDGLIRDEVNVIPASNYEILADENEAKLTKYMWDRVRVFRDQGTKAFERIKSNQGNGLVSVPWKFRHCISMRESLVYHGKFTAVFDRNRFVSTQVWQFGRGKINVPAENFLSDLKEYSGPGWDDGDQHSRVACPEFYRGEADSCEDIYSYEEDEERREEQIEDDKKDGFVAEYVPERIYRLPIPFVAAMKAYFPRTHKRNIAPQRKQK